MSWDINKPPLPPPCEDISETGIETKESKERTRKWKEDSKEYGENLKKIEKITNRFEILDL